MVLMDTSNFLPVYFISFYQWRSVIEPDFSWMMRGMDSRNAMIFAESF